MARILIVDDDNDILKITDALLSRMGHDSRTTTNAARAIEMLSSGTFDLLITDAKMPGYTGFELIKTIKAQPSHKNLAIAMLTASRDKVNLEKAILAGVDDYIVKPIEPPTFLDKVAKLLEKKPPLPKATLEFSPLKEETKAAITCNGAITSLSETGIRLQSKVPYPIGAMVNIEADIFDDIGIHCPPMRVAEVSQVENDYEIHLSFIGAEERVIEKIRTWVYKELGKQKSIVA